MERRYLPLRPAAAGSRVPERRSPEPLEPKRRRVGVAVACNSCRRRKIRCHDQTTRCAYRHEPSSDSPDATVAEVIEILNVLPGAESVRLLSSLRGERDASKILSVVRGGLGRHERASDQPSATTVMGAPFKTLELEVQNPVAYPTLEPFDPGSFMREPYRGLTTAAKDDDMAPRP
ncbi:hypothetical protein PLIIFM63780_005389 [Purpureocillium lilacinum]|nr:hypothetical protein PLIIFM63780_005389 [Purpureocillium lilacinum]